MHRWRRSLGVILVAVGRKRGVFRGVRGREVARGKEVIGGREQEVAHGVKEREVE